MATRGKGKQAVFMAVTPPEFRPQRPWDVPPSLLSASLYAKNLTMPQAHGFARTFNKQQMLRLQQGEWDHLWAIVSKHLKTRQHGLHPDAVVVGEGGAAS